MKTISTLTAIALSVSVSAPALQAEQVNPYTRANNTWISIDGTVDSVSADTFELDYGPGLITVEMDDGDRDADAYKLIRGDKVRVSGKIDDDLFETTTIEAGSVYVENLGTYFYSSALDEEDPLYAYTTPIVVSNTVLRGKITAVSPDADSFTIDTGTRKIHVNTGSMAYNPLDDTGYQKLGKGDRVSVSGDLDLEFFGLKRTLIADTVLTLSSAKHDSSEKDDQTS